MQLGASSSVEEVAAIVSDALTSAGITAVLSGGAAVQIYTSGLCESRDLDFVASASQRELEQVLSRLGFTRQAGRHFVQPTCPYTLALEHACLSAMPAGFGDPVLHAGSQVFWISTLLPTISSRFTYCCASSS